MGAIAAALAWLTPPVPELAGTALTAQRTADTAGPETLVLAAAGLLAWGAWAWGVLGLLLTAASALPGSLGWVADRLVRAVLPEGARRGAALALGLGLSVAGPTAGTAALVVVAPVAAAAPAPALPDWPTASTPTPLGEPPDWPSAPTRLPSGSHLVVPGDCLWDIAAARLAERPGGGSAAEIARATQDWWTANSQVIGTDPDVIVPGQVLRPPPA